MSDLKNNDTSEENVDNDTEQLTEKDELKALRKRATMLGITYSGSTGIQTLREKINAKLNEDTTDMEDSVDDVDDNDNYKPKVDKTKNKTVKVTKETSPEMFVNKSVLATKKANKLVRVIVTCKNPAKSEYQGEIISAGNSLIGTVKKFILFNKPYHVPAILFDVLKERKYQHFYKERINGNIVVKSRLVPEFTVEVLDPLPKKELDKLKTAQFARGMVDTEEGN